MIYWYQPSRAALTRLYAKYVVLELILQLLNLKFRSYTGQSHKFKISFVNDIFIKMKLNYNNQHENKNVFIDSIID